MQAKATTNSIQWRRSIRRFCTAWLRFSAALANLC